nr:thermonuclease family protein [Salinibacter ruber]
MPSPERDPNAGGPSTGENTLESLSDREDRRQQEDTLQRRNAFRREDGSRKKEGSHGEEGEGQFPAGGLIPAAIEVVFLEALSGDALRVSLSAPGRSGPLEEPGASVGRVPAVVYLWGVQAPRPGQPFGAAATEAAGRICKGKRLRVAARRAGPEGRITGSVVAEETGSPGEDTTGKDTTEKGNAGKGSGGNQDVGRALIRLGLAWQDQRRPSSAQLRSLEQKARREEVGLWQQEAPTPPWAWRE